MVWVVVSSMMLVRISSVMSMVLALRSVIMTLMSAIVFTGFSLWSLATFSSAFTVPVLGLRFTYWLSWWGRQQRCGSQQTRT
jgi:hypothetical protein